MPPKVILIGGTSHVGKSTLAGHLAERLGWTARSTDTLARHPGRPWPPQLYVSRPHVAEHYRSLGVDELIASVLAHYRDNIWPMAEGLVREHAADGPALILEGSALLPELVAALDAPGCAAVWITADDATLQDRIRRESGYDDADPFGRSLIDKFAARTRAFNAMIIQDVARLGLPSIAIGPDTTVPGLADQCLDAMRSPRVGG